MDRLRKVLSIFFWGFLLLTVPGIRVSAEELTPVVVSYSSENTITITAKDGRGIGAVYIKWDDPVAPYQVRTDQGTVECGQYGFLHEFILLPEESRTVTVLLPKQKMRLYKKEVRIFTDGEEPEGDLDDYILLCMPVEDYVVEKGENLWKIGESVLGDGNRWKEIAERNNFSNPDMIWPGQKLDMPDRKYYMQKPFFQRGRGYLSDEGAFRFLQPEGWALATCSLDARLSTFIGKDVTVRVLWGIEDNDMGEDAWNGIWDEVCQNVQSTAETVFGENLENIYFEKYFLESGNEVYHICAAFRNETGLRWTVSAAYRFGEKNLMEFIGIGPTEHSIDMGKLTLYTAASYEEYEEERHMGFGNGVKSGEYRGMEVWNYPSLHNPFVLAWEFANGTAWHLKREPAAVEDFVIDWKEPVLPAVLKEALQIKGDIRYSDLLQIETLEAVESAGYDFCSVNGVRYETDWKAIGSGDALVEDLSSFGGLYALRIQIGDITDVSLLEKLTVLEELEILTGAQAPKIEIPAKLRSLKKCTVEKAPLQDYVDALDESIWERTCREQKITTFQRSEGDG